MTKVKNNAIAVNESKFDLSMVNAENLDALFSNDVFKEEGTIVANENVILKEEQWDGLEDQEINIIYFGDEEFKGDNEDLVNAVVFHSDFPNPENKDKKPYTCAQSVLVNRLQKSGFGLYKVTYVGRKKSTQNKTRSYMDYVVKLIRKF